MARITLLAAALVALPACGKKTEPAGGGSTPDPVANYTGSKAGPPGGFPPPSGNGKVPPSGWGDAQIAPARKQTEDSLKQIGLALHNFEGVYGALPAGIYDKSGKALGLSWRVAILPYIEQVALYKQFKLDEPWDSDHNKALIPMMPRQYAPPVSAPPGHTYYRGFTGKDMLFAPPTKPGQPGMVAMGPRFIQISDGTVNTAMVVEAAESVPWTKPDTLDVDPKDVTKTVGGVHDNVFYALRCDGSWTPVKKTITPATLRNFAVINDGNVVELPK